MSSAATNTQKKLAYLARAATNTQKKLAYLARALKAPHLLAAAERLAPIARESNWSHEQ